MLSIIIPVWNQHELTRECLWAVRDTTPEPYEIIVVDNGSDPPIEGATIRNEENLGFPVAVNQGIRASKGDIICLLNNDVICTPYWSEKLIAALDEYAIVGPMTDTTSGHQSISIPIYYDREELYKRAIEFSKDRAGRTMDTNWIIGFCFMFKRALYDELGEFDESIWPSSGEEIDFCFRAREKGYRVGYIQDVYVHHEGSVSFIVMRDTGMSYEEIVEKSHSNLKKKWGEDFWQRQLLPLTDGKGIRLNIGCGLFHKEGFVDVDRSDSVNADVIADVLHLPYDSGTVDEIYAGHILEHFTFSTGAKALHHWHDLLKEGGLISVAVPDFDWLVRDYISNPTAKRLKDFCDRYIYSESQESPHLYAYNEALLIEAMTDAGFVDLKRMPVDHPYFPIPVDWQVAYSGRKGVAK